MTELSLKRGCTDESTLLKTFAVDIHCPYHKSLTSIKIEPRHVISNNVAF